MTSSLFSISQGEIHSKRPFCLLRSSLGFIPSVFLVIAFYSVLHMHVAQSKFPSAVSSPERNSPRVIPFTVVDSCIFSYAYQFSQVYTFSRVFKDIAFRGLSTFMFRTLVQLSGTEETLFSCSATASTSSIKTLVLCGYLLGISMNYFAAS